MIYKLFLLDNGKAVPAMAGRQFRTTRDRLNIKGRAPGFSSYICLFTAPSESVFEVNETMERIEKIPAEEPVPVFARIDHGKNVR